MYILDCKGRPIGCEPLKSAHTRDVLTFAKIYSKMQENKYFWQWIEEEKIYLDLNWSSAEKAAWEVS